MANNMEELRPEACPNCGDMMYDRGEGRLECERCHLGQEPHPLMQQASAYEYRRRNARDRTYSGEATDNDPRV